MASTASRTSLSAASLSKLLKSKANATIAKHSMRFFKTGKGEYGEGDKFLGIRVPELRKLASEKEIAEDLPIREVETLLSSSWHEERLFALLVLVYRFPKASLKEKESIYNFYLEHTKWINNWDLVDTTAYKIVGPWLYDTNSSRKVLYDLAKSSNLWERRIAILSTMYFIGKREFRDTLQLAEMYLQDEQDLIHKATGWMLREVGKQDLASLKQFLDSHYGEMPRVMLRYAIEKLPIKERQEYLASDRGSTSKKGTSDESAPTRSRKCPRN